jgi:hypothetical protein
LRPSEARLISTTFYFEYLKQGQLRTMGYEFLERDPSTQVLWLLKFRLKTILNNRERFKYLACFDPYDDLSLTAPSEYQDWDPSQVDFNQELFAPSTCHHYPIYPSVIFVLMSMNPL